MNPSRTTTWLANIAFAFAKPGVVVVGGGVVEVGGFRSSLQPMV